MNTYNPIWLKLVSLDSFADINLNELSTRHATFLVTVCMKTIYHYEKWLDKSSSFNSKNSIRFFFRATDLFFFFSLFPECFGISWGLGIAGSKWYNYINNFTVFFPQNCLPFSIRNTETSTKRVMTNGLDSIILSFLLNQSDEIGYKSNIIIETERFGL